MKLVGVSLVEENQYWCAPCVTLPHLKLEG